MVEDVSRFDTFSFWIFGKVNRDVSRSVTEGVFPVYQPLIFNYTLPNQTKLLPSSELKRHKIALGVLSQVVDSFTKSALKYPKL